MENGILPIVRDIPHVPKDVPEEALIRGEKIILRPITLADTDWIVVWRNDPHVRDRFVYRENFTRNTHEIWLRECVATGLTDQFIICEIRTDEVHYCRKCAACHPNGRPVGSVYLRDIEKEEARAEYGIFIGEQDARGKGYSSEAVRLMLRYAFETLGLKTVSLRVFQDNAPAIASYKQAGFRIVKELKDVIATDGKTGDMYWMEACAENHG